MRFSRILLLNWRNFGHVEVHLQNRAFLVGPNASGKSNFLDAFRFLRDITSPGGGFQKAVAASDLSDGTLRLLGLLWALMDGSGPLLLEEPELSLHSEIVQRIPQMMLRVQRGQKRVPRQVLMSTHSSDLLSDEGIAGDEVLLFQPREGGTEVRTGADIEEVRRLLETGLPPAEVVIPYTRPESAEQLSLFSD